MKKLIVCAVICLNAVLMHGAGNVFNILDYGALADTAKLSTEAIQWMR